MATTDPEDYPLFRRRLKEAEDEAARWQAHALALVRSEPGAAQEARADLVSAGLLGAPKRETCRERRKVRDKANREWRRMQAQST